MGCDRGSMARRFSASHFNPRIPYGMRQSLSVKRIASRSISIHASRMGCDVRADRVHHHQRHFNPRIPYGMRPFSPCGPWSPFDFNPRIPYGMRLHKPTVPHQSTHISIHASRMGCDTRPRQQWSATGYFNPRIPYGMRPVIPTIRTRKL